MSLTISIQQPLRPAYPKVFGSKDYRDEEMMLLKMDRILIKSHIEDLFVKLSVENYAKELESKKIKKDVKIGLLKKHALKSSQALRCTILKNLVGGSYRKLSVWVGLSEVYRRFCRLEEIGKVPNPPSKSTLQQYAHWLPEEQIRQVIKELTLALHDEEKAVQIGLEKAIEMEIAFVDTTCLQANIHYPVDWLLLRDEVRSLMKTVTTIRKHGLRKRMAEPMSFLTQINALCIAMSKTTRKAGGKKERKTILRHMKKIVNVVEKHAKRYYEALDKDWEKTDLSRAEVECFLKRLKAILTQLPAAKKQAQERIIQGKKIPSDQKILSLYEANTNVINRGKTGAPIEFGNELFIAENRLGLIIDHELLKDRSPGDAHLLLSHLEQLKIVTGGSLAALSGDRKFDTKLTQQKLLEEKLFNGICSKDPKKLSYRLEKEERFVEMLKRRSQTEGRIGILKNLFLQGTPKAKGFKNRNLQVAWAVLSHNLWVMARRGVWKEDELAPLAA